MKGTIILKELKSGDKKVFHFTGEKEEIKNLIDLTLFAIGFSKSSDFSDKMVTTGGLHSKIKDTMLCEITIDH